MSSRPSPSTSSSQQQSPAIVLRAALLHVRSSPYPLFIPPKNMADNCLVVLTSLDHFHRPICHGRHRDGESECCGA
jgi:hypothetical protein